MAPLRNRSYRAWRGGHYRKARQKPSRVRGAEPLEVRAMLSIAAAADAPPIERMLWKGQDVDVYAGRWIVGIDDAGIESLLAATGAVAAQGAAGLGKGDLLAPPAVQAVDGWLDGRAALAALKVSRSLGTAGNERLFELDAPADSTVGQWQAALSQLPGFRYVEPDFVLSTTVTTPNDTLYSTLWGMNNTGQTGGTADADIDAPEAWDLATGSSDIVVGVIDTGVDYTHSDLAANIWTNPGEIPGDGIDNDNNGFVDDIRGWDFANDDNDPMDDNNHGTHVSGTIGAAGNNSNGVVGVNWNVRIMALKYLGADGNGSTSNAVEALNYATMMRRDYGVNVRLTSNSWGGGGFSQSLYNAIAASRDQDMLFIAAAGNGDPDGIGDDNDSVPFYPATYDLDNIISVAATDDDDQKAGFSNFGASTVDLGAPGVSVRSTIAGGGYANFSGTSMATPHVAGVAALAWSIAPTASYQTIRDAIFGGVDPIPSMNGITATGGRLNARGALDQLGMRVTSTSPAKGSVITDPRTDFVVNFSNAYVAGSVDAGDLTVNGTPADSFTLTDADTITFHYNATPIVGQGLQTVAIADGAITRASDSAPLHAYSGAFRYDQLPMAVTSTVPANGTTATLPLTAIAVNLNEPYDPATVGIDDLALNQGTVTGVSLAGNSVTYNVAGLSNEGTLTLSMKAGALTDVYGNPMVAYSGSVTLDYGVFPLPTPLAAVAPNGGLVYDSTAGGSIGVVGDSDSFTLKLLAGQVLTVVADPAAGLLPTLSLYDPSSVLVASATATAAGKDAVLQTLPAATSGTYKITIAGAGSTTGSYTLQVILNAAAELESHDAPTGNDTFGNAQNLNAGFVTVGAGPTVAAVLGRTDPQPNAPLPAEIESNNTTGTANSGVYNFASYSSNLYQLAASGTISPSGDADWFNIGALQAADVITVSLSGSASSRGTLVNPVIELYRGSAASPTLVTSDDDSGPGSDSLIYRFTVSVGDTYYLRARAFSTGTGTYQLAAWLENSDTAPTTGGTLTSETESNNTAATANNASTSWRAIGYRSHTTGTITSGDSDFYKFTLSAGDVVTVVADSTSSLDARVTLLNSVGTVIAAEDGTSVGPGVDSTVYAYRITTTGTYYVRVQPQSGTGAYNADVYLSTTTPPPAPSVPTDWYAFDLTAGERATLVLKGLSTGNVDLALANPSAVDVATGVAGTTNADEMIHQFVAPSTGTYFARVTGDANVDYNLQVIRGGEFDSESNDSPAGSLVDLTSVQRAAGFLDRNRPLFTTPVTFTIDQAQSVVETQADIEGTPFVPQAPGSLVTNYQGSLVAMVQPGTIQFTGSSVIDAIAHPGPFQPGNVPADYAAQLELFPGTTIYGIFQNLVFDATSGVLAVSPGGTFDSGKVTTAVSAGDLVYTVGSLGGGTYSLIGLTTDNQSTQPATLQEVNGVLYLTVPIEGSDSLIDPNTGLQVNIRLTGQIVASLVLPPPIDADDYYQVTLAPGEYLTASTRTPFDAANSAALNTLDPTLELLDSNGIVVAADANSASDGRNAVLHFTSATGGTYRIRVDALAGKGEYMLDTSIEASPPAIVGAFVDSSAWNPAFRAALATAGLGDATLGYAVPGGAGPASALPWANVDRVSLRFDRDVQVQAGELSVNGTSVATYGVTSFSYDPATFTATWVLAQPVPNDQLTLHPDPGPTGGDFYFRVLPGDYNQDNLVDVSDIQQVAAHWLQSDPLTDGNGDNLVDISDIQIIAAHWLEANSGGGAGGGANQVTIVAASENQRLANKLAASVGQTDLAFTDHADARPAAVWLTRPNAGSLPQWADAALALDRTDRPARDLSVTLAKPTDTASPGTATRYLSHDAGHSTPFVTARVVDAVDAIVNDHEFDALSADDDAEVVASLAGAAAQSSRGSFR
ncbi:MAG: S8 family serine peptidase [Planctomycetia bacterium]|nr:S8 family serine peptidase [Planctomycetia bacterium]